MCRPSKALRLVSPTVIGMPLAGALSRDGGGGRRADVFKAGHILSVLAVRLVTVEVHIALARGRPYCQAVFCTLWIRSAGAVGEKIKRRGGYQRWLYERPVLSCLR